MLLSEYKARKIASEASKPPEASHQPPKASKLQNETVWVIFQHCELEEKENLVVLLMENVTSISSPVEKWGHKVCSVSLHVGHKSHFYSID